MVLKEVLKVILASCILRFTDTEQYRNQSYEALAPLMLPELSKLSEIIIEGDASDHRYWPVRLVLESTLEEVHIPELHVFDLCKMLYIGLL